MKKLGLDVRSSNLNLKSAISKSLATITLVASCQIALAQNITDPTVHHIQGYSSVAKIPNQYIVVLDDAKVMAEAALRAAPGFSMAEARAAVVRDMGISMATQARGSMDKTYSTALHGFVIKTRASKKVAALLKDPRVKHIEADQRVSVVATQSNATWGLDRIDQANLPLNNTYNYDFNGTGVNAYVIDTGVRISHNQFGGRGRSGYTAINDGNGTNDCQGHGTHVAGTIGSSTYGVAKNATIYAVRVLGCDGSGSNSGVIGGVDWVAANHVKPAVANMSLGGGASSALDSAVNSAVSQGITMVVAAGNDNRNACNYSPARATNAMTVGSTTSSDARSSFSNYGTCLDIYAPGSSITSTWSTSNSATNTISGTSMAAPHVAGVAALYLDEFPGASPAQVEAAIEGAAIPNKVTDAKTGSPNLLLNNFSGGGNPDPDPDPDPVGGELANGTAKTGLSGASGSQTFFTLQVPAGATDLSFATSGGSGDADMYVRFGSAPTTSTYDCRPYKNGNNETCDIANVQAGTYHVMLRGYSAFSGVSLVGSFTPPAGGGGGGGSNFFENTNNVTISSGAPSTVSSVINVSRTGASGTITIKADIKHTYRGDLSAKIFAPNGASGTVHARTNTSDSGDNLLIDVDLNAGSIESSGQWRLEVTDHANQDGGFIDSWSIEFQ
ncbi:S8 family serine peptidase [Marinicella sp. S1101]|uniref:S8 family serine peptidase n=1 Tax=Marinicella marina TaxID=2996016 RepID=UPI002260A6EB|nr:S8 family serine peptidase [Marinicella marina]MCX7553742.1 S8 family serine peptidase [Marinicella marina]